MQLLHDAADVRRNAAASSVPSVAKYGSGTVVENSEPSSVILWNPND